MRITPISVKAPPQEANHPVLSCLRTPWYVLNKDTLSATPNPADPFHIATFDHSEASDNLNCVILRNPGLPHLNLLHYINPTNSGGSSSGNDSDATGDLVVNCFGFFPQVGETDRATNYMPNLYDESNFDSVRDPTIGDGLWLPLFNPRTGEFDITFTAGEAEIHKASPSENNLSFRLHSENNYVYTNGCREILAVIKTATTGIAAGMLLGSLSA